MAEGRRVETLVADPVAREATCSGLEMEALDCRAQCLDRRMQELGWFPWRM